VAFVEVPRFGALDSAYMHEHLSSTACRLNEAEALRRIERFHCPSSRRHLIGRLLSAAGARSRVSRHNI
jgi:3-oxoacyl-(acyl-carrier-protein) synthase